MILRVLAGLLATLLLIAPAAGAADGLDQRIDRGQAVVDGRKVIATGHVDVGPRFVDGRWTLMIHDDEAKSKPGGRSVWRHAEQTVLRVGDVAIQTVPDDPAYAFLHAAGRQVYVVPQTQDLKVVWVGWNTQDPDVMERIDRGVRLTLTDVEGPGELVVFLQSGDFAEPQVLWDSTAAARPVWVDVNTHTHANWVFTEPGVYLVHVRVDAELIDGTTVSDTRAMRFAVGRSASPEKAFSAVDAAAGSGDDSAAPASPAEPVDDGGGSSALIAVLAVLAVALTVALAAVLARGRRTKQRARSAPGAGR
ncbi:choice-of-anchor M domain-containing protein [Conexibacter sp. JD483]|uniref:choice-of-anchor M domain-containing protein n=1 Tax=unclassified Conexibacter TaxID=2627773 RepID=UPI00272498A2|nr:MULTISPECIES: choice-of-anchor M domain-containing protein [unclassified Conexibacter]MDO8183963.1 choice-of-anchor M domain-containing protein [Conexibacter sp. CPCC 205706]MDO8196955.1 choice-of-anchor M domain-containing protein [Conexibacter sp. CPCC 205762]MDR9369075.1 choice-of-anchor M domain-containing protein [Conexibacter sp. JD483]